MCSLLSFAFLVVATALTRGDDAFGWLSPSYLPAKVLGRIGNKSLDEISGMAVGRRNSNVLWVHNDGAAEKLFAVTRTGDLVGTLGLGFATVDLEDIAIDTGPSDNDSYILLGDIGDNNSSRESITIFRAPEPRVESGKHLARVEAHRFRYIDGARNAETLMADPARSEVFVVTKEPNRGGVYLATLEAARNDVRPLEFVCYVDVPFATAGDISPDGRLIAIRSDRQARMWVRKEGEGVSEALQRKGVAIPLVGRSLEEAGESIAFEPDSAAYLTLGEGKRERIFGFRPNHSVFTHGEKIGSVEEKTLNEISGCAISLWDPDVLWVHNDGKIEEIHAIDLQGNILTTLQLGQTLVDPEDIATARLEPGGQPWIFVGDIGDNHSERSSVVVLKIPEPRLDLVPAVPSTIIAQDAERLTFQYPNGAVDAEALMIDPASRQLLIASKENLGTRIYGGDVSFSDEKARALKLITSLSFQRVSGGDISGDGQSLVLRREDYARIWRRKPGESVASMLRRPGVELPIMSPPVEPNGEAIAFNCETSGYFTVGEEAGAPIFQFYLRPISTIARLLPNPIVRAGEVRWPIEGLPGISITIQKSHDLGTWQDMSTMAIGDNGTAAFLADNTAEKTFFRIVR